MITLNIKERGKKEDLNKLREGGSFPAVFYGKKEEATSISIKLADFLKVWKEAGESSVITLEGDLGKKEALIKSVDVNPVTGTPRHADFYVFEKGHMLQVSIPLEFTGVSPAIKELGGALVKVLHELNIKAKPQDLPHEIIVDISNLVDFNSKILAKDIKLPNGVELEEEPEEVIALVEDIKEEVEEESAPVDLSSIEVEKKGKQAEETESSSEEKSE